MMSENIAAEMKRPRVSVVLPTDRVDSFLPSAIRSILDQTFRDFELILVLNEHVADRRSQLEDEFRDVRIRIVEVTALGGLALALNIGIGAATGEYIARMDGDDISLPHRLVEQVAFLDAHPKTVVLGGRMELIDENGAPVPILYPYYGTNVQIRGILPIRNPMPHPALMMRRSAIVATGGYRYGNTSEDYEFFLRMARNPDYEFANLDSVILRYRRHSQQMTNQEYFRKRFSESAGFLLTETLMRRSPKYLVGMAVAHPWARSVRSLVAKVRPKP